ncbi:related to TAD3 Subunit of tRNA-specific adenosine-34 deaminase [Cephalotrichum gorgonifer]|uniref:Related to TAD3 Subunit of tRNA-specific adenosine-34 deaminase n=1 Tax=Cephalotrichum gorgonifer TaxID=2041049 RepID=A0AAE8SWX1_9PEZI|nr:related to TAD3 Subunit of tRNA-specific adenosine-34 deaminase [Cephalotrichum gorgonifer]
MDSSVAAVSTKATTPNGDPTAIVSTPLGATSGDDAPPFDRLPGGPPATTANTALSMADRPPPGPSEVVPNPLLEGIDHKAIDKGVLIPLKTTLEVRQDHSVVSAYITRSPTRCANELKEGVLGSLADNGFRGAYSLLRGLISGGDVKSLPHLRRCAKPSDLPAHLKTQLMNESPEGRQIHTGKSNWIYIVLGEVKYIDKDELVKALASVDGIDDPFIANISVPANPPTSQVHAAMWTSQFWPTVYRKNNPLGPHPSLLSRATEEIKHDVSLWMNLAYRVAREAKKAGIGEPMGAVIVQREEGKVQVLSVAGDARWRRELPKSPTGNPIAHCALRAISMVAQKLVRHERRAMEQPIEDPELEFDPFQDRPLLEEERIIFEEEHPNPDGYLCHGLELYLTHEPCVQCSMGILHSRMGKVVFAHRQSLTGGFCSEDRGAGPEDMVGETTGDGLGLFWRRELNWSLLAWEWEPGEDLKPLPPLKPTAHP